jgi:hypothetical protein
MEEQHHGGARIWPSATHSAESVTASWQWAPPAYGMRGDAVLASLGAANRADREFPHADTLDVSGRIGPHLAVPTEQLRWKPGRFMRGIIEMPISWG